MVQAGTRDEYIILCIPLFISIPLLHPLPSPHKWDLTKLPVLLLLVSGDSPISASWFLGLQI
jgi:hypothetical protein